MLLNHETWMRQKRPTRAQLNQRCPFCTALSIDVNDSDVHRWAASNKPEELAWLASAGKRARAEVCIKNLNIQEKLLFEKAKNAELNCWIQTSALKPIL